jgi:hypothetical protein
MGCPKSAKRRWICVAGFRVHPLNGKVPLLTGWPELATTDIPTIKEWWGTLYQTANVGIVTGNGLLVVDVDPDADGLKSLRELEMKYGALPPTVTVLTGRDGLHLYFRYSNTQRIGNSAGKLGPGIDIKCEHGQVVGVSSIHPETLKAYEWSGDGHPDDVPVAEVPDWLVRLLTLPLPKKRFECPPVIPEHTRQETLFRFIRSLRHDRNLTDEEIMVLIRTMNEPVPPSPGEDELEETIEHALTYGDRDDFVTGAGR